MFCEFIFLFASLVWSSSPPSSPNFAVLILTCTLGIDLAPHRLLLIGPVIPSFCPRMSSAELLFNQNTLDIFQLSHVAFGGRARPIHHPCWVCRGPRGLPLLQPKKVAFPRGGLSMGCGAPAELS